MATSREVMRWVPTDVFRNSYRTQGSTFLYKLEKTHGLSINTPSIPFCFPFLRGRGGDTAEEGRRSPAAAHGNFIGPICPDRRLTRSPALSCQWGV